MSGFVRSLLNESNMNSTRFCKNCGFRLYQDYDYCSKACSTAAETRRDSAAQAASAHGPPTSVARQDQLSYSLSSGPNAPTASNMCENCLSRSKSQEQDEDGTVITHLYCGIRCYQASQQTPTSTIPAPAAVIAGHEPLALRIERINTPLGRKISLMMQERWKSDASQIPKLKAIYRINLPGQVYRRFDLALQMNDGCPVRTTYYGGIAACSLASDANPTPCTSESCGLCDALRSSFSNLLHGESCSDGDYGPGLYTYSNPASAYHATVPADDMQPQGSNFALIQCRVVAKADSLPNSNLYAGFIDDSGVVLCTQPTAIIPTHLLICNATAPPKASPNAIPVNSNSVSLGSAPSTATPIAGSIGQVESSDTSRSKPNPFKGNKGKGKAQAKPIPQKPQEKGSGLASSSKQQPGADLTESGAANQGFLNSPQSAPTPASKSGSTYPSAAQEKAQLLAAINEGSLNSPQSGGSYAPQVVPAPKATPGAYTDAESSAPPPPSYGEDGAAGTAMPHAIYQRNLASPGPSCFYAHTDVAGFIPLPNPPPPGIDLFVLGADGYFYPAPPATATRAYPTIPVSVISPRSAANQGLLSTPAPDPATAALRAVLNPDTRGSPPGSRSSPANAAAANKYIRRSRVLESRMDEDDDDFNPLKSNENLAKR